MKNYSKDGSLLFQGLSADCADALLSHCDQVSKPMDNAALGVGDKVVLGSDGKNVGEIVCLNEEKTAGLCMMRLQYLNQSEDSWHNFHRYRVKQERDGADSSSIADAELFLFKPFWWPTIE